VTPAGSRRRTRSRRTVRLSVDRATVDTRRLCPACFADWIRRYRDRLGSESDGSDEDSEIIVD